MKLFDLVRRWLDRSTPQERAEMERRRAHWVAAASHAAQNLVLSALKHRDGISDQVFVDCRRDFSDKSTSFIRALVAEQIEANITSFDLRALAHPELSTKLGLQLVITDQEVLKKLHPARVAM